LIRNLTGNISPLSKTKKCRTCGNTATKEVLYDVGNDVSVLERYCDPCAAVVLEGIKGSLA
jgi:hypothetical protein